jgi:hypothetical protein
MSSDGIRPLSAQTARQNCVLPVSTRISVIADFSAIPIGNVRRVTICNVSVNSVALTTRRQIENDTERERSLHDVTSASAAL